MPRNNSTPRPTDSRRYTSIGKAITAFCIGIFLFIILIPGCWMMAPHINNYLSRQDFNAEKWSRGEGQNRLHMVHDLTENYGLLGMSRREVEALLGSKRDSNSPSLSYDLGYVGSGIDHAVLRLRLNAKDTVIGYGVYYH